MTSFFRWFLHAIEDALCVRKQGYTGTELRSILKSYIGLSLKLPFERGEGSKLRTVHMCNFRVFGYNRSTLFFLFREIFVHGEYNFHSSASSPVIYDVGANNGVATLFFAWRYPKSVVHAFEPDPTAFELLKKNVTVNSLKNVHLYNVAIGGKNGAVDFYADTTKSGSLRMGVGQTRANGELVSVPMNCLSQFIKPSKTPILVKMDIEGSETETIHELSEAKALTNIDQMVIEYHHHINKEPALLSHILIPLEATGFEYQIACLNRVLTVPDRFQDIMLFCYKREKKS